MSHKLLLEEFCLESLPRLDFKLNLSPANGISYNTRSGMKLDWSSTASGVV